MEKMIVGKVHRVWIVDPQTRPIGVVAMSNILRILFDTMKK